VALVRVAACQLNLRVGDLDGNVECILAAYEEASSAGADIAVFSELAVCGYPPEDLLLKPAFVDDVQAAARRLAEATGDCVAVVGFVDGEEAAADPNRRASNAAMVAANGAVHGVYHKRALPDYGVFDEERYFRPGSEPLNLYEVAGVNVGLTICEDVWISGGVVSELAAGGAELIVNLNASPYYAGKTRIRELVVGERIGESGLPIVYVNQVGGQDELVFDGASFAMDAHGGVVALAPHCEEAVVVFDIEAAPTAVASTFPVVALSGPTASRTPIPPSPVPIPDVMGEIWQALVLGTRDYVHKNGFTDIGVALSGGVDSALVAAIACDALGAGHVHTVAMPSRYSSDHSLRDAARLADRLGCHHLVVPIETAHAAFLEMLVPSFTGHDADVTEENLQSRIRGTLIMALANKFGWLVLTTGNKSELAVGYSTLYGDTAGAFAVIKDIWKLQVYELCRWKNDSAGREIILESILSKAPSAELRPGQRDDQSLPPYEVLDPLLVEIVEHDRVVSELIASGHEEATVRRIARLVDIAEFKRRQNPVGPKVSIKAFGRDRRVPMTNSYRGAK